MSSLLGVVIEAYVIYTAFSPFNLLLTAVASVIEFLFLINLYASKKFNRPQRNWFNKTIPDESVKSAICSFLIWRIRHIHHGILLIRPIGSDWMTELISDNGKWAIKIERRCFRGQIREILIEKVYDNTFELANVDDS